MTKPITQTTFLRTYRQRKWFLIWTFGVLVGVPFVCFYFYVFGWKLTAGIVVGFILFRQAMLGMMWLGGWVERGERQ